MDRIEVLLGPGSVGYGSDAMGGMIHLRTKNPSITGDRNIHGSSTLRYSSAANEKLMHAEINKELKKCAFFTSVSVKDIADLRSGRKLNPSYSEFGKVYSYCKTNYTGTVSGSVPVDSIVKNPNPDIQKYSGYRQGDVLFKALFTPGSSWEHLLNIQYSTSGNINRFDRLQEEKTDTSTKYSEWYYGPQNRFFSTYTAEYSRHVRFSDRIILRAAYQKIDEDRTWRRFKETEFYEQKEDVHVYGIAADFDKKVRNQVLNYGADAYYNRVGSKGVIRDTGVRKYYPSRYPDNSEYLQGGIYILYKALLMHGLNFTAGFRISCFLVKARFENLSFLQGDLNQKHLNPAASLNILRTFRNRYSLSFSSGFRAPNIDDLGKIGEVPAKKGEAFEISNTALKPEYAYDLETGMRFHPGDKFSAEIHLFSIYLKDLIERKRSVFSGTDSINVNGITYAVYQKQNAGKGMITGSGCRIVFTPSRQFSFQWNGNYVYGEDFSSHLPLAHIPPFSMQADFVFSPSGNGWFIPDKFILYISHNGWKRPEKINYEGEDRFLLTEGYPAWATANIKAEFSLGKSWRVSGGIENILDINYRTFNSGINAPGRNFIISVRNVF